MALPVRFFMRSCSESTAATVAKGADLTRERSPFGPSWLQHEQRQSRRRWRGSILLVLAQRWRGSGGSCCSRFCILRLPTEVLPLLLPPSSSFLSPGCLPRHPSPPSGAALRRLMYTSCHCLCHPLTSSSSSRFISTHLHHHPPTGTYSLLSHIFAALPPPCLLLPVVISRHLTVHRRRPPSLRT